MAGKSTPVSLSEQQVTAGDFDLSRFFPYLVRIFYANVSASVGESYAPKLKLTPAEWRTLAVLGPHKTLSASDIGERSSMTKVHVSRAIKSLQKKNFIRRDIDGDDKRKASLRMTATGITSYNIIVADALMVEEVLLRGLSEDEISQLLSTMDKIIENAATLGVTGTWW